MIAPKIVVFMQRRGDLGRRSRWSKNVAKNGPSGASFESVTSIPPNVPKSSAKTLSSAVSAISARKRGSDEALDRVDAEHHQRVELLADLARAEVGADRRADDARP